MTDAIVALHPANPAGHLESRILGAVLSAGAQANGFILSSGLGPDSFRMPKVRVAWQVLTSMARKGEAISALLVFARAQAANALGAADGPWLERLELENVTPVSELEPLAAQLLLGRERGETANAIGKLAAEMREGGVPDEQVFARLDGVLKSMRAGASGAPSDEVVHRLLTRWDAVTAGTAKADLIPTGIRLLDEEIGGLPANLVLLVGEPGGGKTGAVCSMIRAQLSDPDMMVGAFLLEDGAEGLVRRWMAADLGMSLREVARVKLTPEQTERAAEVAEGIGKELQRVFLFQEHRVSRAQLLRTAYRWVKMGARCIYIDNFSQLISRSLGERTTSRDGNESHWQAVDETAEQLRSFAKTHGVPVVGVVHKNLTTDRNGKPASGPAKLGELRGGQALDQKARLLLSVWRKEVPNEQPKWRCTIVKANELAEAGKTFQFARIAHAGLIDPSGGEWVSILSEQRAEMKAKREEREASQEEARKARAAKKALEKAAAEKPAEPAEAVKDPQGELL